MAGWQAAWFHQGPPSRRQHGVMKSFWAWSQSPCQLLGCLNIPPLVFSLIKIRINPLASLTSQGGHMDVKGLLTL